MKILPLLVNNNIRFTSDYKYDNLEEDNNVHNFLIDEEENYSHDSYVRDAIRAHMYSQFLPNYGLGTGRSNAYASSIEDVYIQNLQKLDTSCYRGASLSKNLQYIPLLVKSKVYNVIDLVGYYDLEHKCKEYNIDYLRYPVSADYWANPIFRTDAELLTEKKEKLAKLGLSKAEYDKEISLYKRDIDYERKLFMKNFLTLIDTINKNNFYIGCEFGEYRTPNILALNTYFNPHWKGKKTYPTSEFVYTKMKNMYLNLTAEDKIRLGFTKGFEENLKIELGLADE